MTQLAGARVPPLIRRQTTIRAVALSLLVVLLSACGPSGGATLPSPGPPARADIDAPVTRLVPPSKEILDIAWPRADLILVTGMVPNPKPFKRTIGLFGLIRGSQALRRLRLDSSASCPEPGQVTDLKSPEALGDGRTMVVRSCRGSLRQRDAILALKLEGTRVSADALVRSVEPILDSTSWDLASSRGVFDNNSDICAGIALVDASGLHPFDVPMGDENSEWSLATHFTERGSCDANGLAKTAQWVPGSSNVLFAASNSAAGVAGLARVDLPWTLFLMDVDNPDPVPLADGIRHLFAPRVSRDGSWAVFGAGSSTSTVPKGTWLLHLASRQLVRVSGTAMNCDWSPSGEMLACLGNSSLRPPVVEVDVRAVVREGSPSESPSVRD